MTIRSTTFARLADEPVRVQLSRRKGWRMPPNTVKVSRPTQWGNPFVVGQPFVRTKMQPGGGECSGTVESAASAVRLYKRFMPLDIRIGARIQLAGKNLACWCKLDAPCHADVLLAIANG